VMIEFDLEFTSDPTKQHAVDMEQKVRRCTIFLQVRCVRNNIINVQL
jgi:hypothetical protein